VLLLASSAAVTVHNAILQEQLYQAHLGTIYRLAVVAEYRDNDTGDHIRRVSRTSELIARAMGMENELVERIKNASQMHDVGKVAVPDSILLKPGHLTTEQRAVMEKHTTIAAEILGHPEDEVLAMGRDIALNHHERWDGQGYPNGISGRDIPLSARVVAVADVFDAVISHRCYKTACSFDVALDIIAKDSGRHFDPEVTQAFFIAIDDILESYRSSEACR
jgi:putative two-component system response regulator